MHADNSLPRRDPDRDVLGRPALDGSQRVHFAGY